MSQKKVTLSDDIHVWRIGLNDLESKIEQFEAVLSYDERRRADRFRFERDRKQFILSRGALRNLLGKYLELSAHHIEFTQNRYGKPALVNREKLTFNLSHSGGLALVAVARNTEIGVDVEVVNRQLDFLPLADRFFSEAEYREIVTSSESDRSILFYRCWTGKEAVVKARGKGLSIPLDTFAVSLEQTGSQVVSLVEKGKEASTWRLVPIDVGEGYAGAIAYEGGARDLILMDWDSIRDGEL